MPHAESCAQCKTYSVPFGRCTACGVRLCPKCTNASTTRCKSCGGINKVKRL